MQPNEINLSNKRGIEKIFDLGLPGGFSSTAIDMTLRTTRLNFYAQIKIDRGAAMFLHRTWSCELVCLLKSYIRSKHSGHNLKSAGRRLVDRKLEMKSISGCAY